MKKRTALIAAILAVATLFASIPAAHAGLAQIGPINPVSGFPDWYMDANGIALEPCLTPAARCATTPVIVGNPASEAAGFGDEAFYQLVTPFFPLGPDGEDCNATVHALELAWNTVDGAPAAGRQIVFSRLRIRCSNMQLPGTYTVVTPFGTRRVPALPEIGNRGPFRLNFTDDDIGGAGNGFATPLASPNIGPFLVQTAPAPPAGFIGSGAGAPLFTGGPNGNLWQVFAPGGALLTQTNRAAIVGKKATNGGLQRVTATYARTATGSGTVSVTAHSITRQRIVAVGVGATAARLLPVAGDLGMYSGTAPFTAGQAFSPVTVRNLTDVSRPSVIVNPVVDVVTITSATWSSSTQTLRVVANTSDRATAAPRTRLDVFNPATGAPLGRMTLGGVFSLVTPVRPATVRVMSTAGGRSSARVTVVP